MAGKFGLDPHRLDDVALERELRYLYATREETFFHGHAPGAPESHRAHAPVRAGVRPRFRERTKADALRTRKGSRSQAGQSTGR